MYGEKYEYVMSLDDIYNYYSISLIGKQSLLDFVKEIL